MKRLLIAAMIFTFCLPAIQAQDATWYFLTGAHFVDYKAPDGGAFLDTKNWNGDAMPKQFYLGRSFMYGLELGTSISVLRIEEYPDELLNDNFFDWDLMLSYKPLYKKVLDEGHWFDPYIWLGGGITRINAETNPLVDFGLGMDFWITEYVALDLHSAYDMAMGDGKSYTHHGVGIKFRIRGEDVDTDGDGIVDRLDDCPKVAGPAENKGCPALSAEKEKEIQDQIMFAAKNIQFETASDVIRKESYKDLDNIVAIMNAFPNTRWDIMGHTDNTGDDAMNLDLSKRRAASVKKYFMDKGISASRLFSEGYGESKPIATNDTPEGRAQNRRVEIKMKK